MPPTDQDRSLTFEQREGHEPLPSQLQLGTLPRSVTAPLWAVVYQRLRDACPSNSSYVRGNWEGILKDFYVNRLHQDIDNFSSYRETLSSWVKAIITSDNYILPLGLIEFILRHPRCPSTFAPAVDSVLEKTRAAYRVMQGDTIVPLASSAEAQAVKRAFEDLGAPGFGGGRQHLIKASAALTAGHFADAVRESIHAVEAVARSLEPKATTLGPALTALEKRGHIHPAMMKGFQNLYGYTSNEGGIRHALLDDGDVKVDQGDALYMFGACASFVTYMIAKSTD